MKKVTNNEAELKKSVTYKKKRVILYSVFYLHIFSRFVVNIIQTKLDGQILSKPYQSENHHVTFLILQ